MGNLLTIRYSSFYEFFGPRVTKAGLFNLSSPAKG